MALDMDKLQEFLGRFVADLGLPSRPAATSSTIPRQTPTS
jgi:hypothetical protein